MRLDHLLSTEFSGRRSGVRRVAHAPGMVPGFGVGVLVWKRSLASRVLGAGGQWYGYAFGFPDRHPRLGRVRFSGCPLGAVGRPVCRVRIVAWARGGLRTG